MSMKKIKILHSILKHIYCLGVVIFTLPYILIIAGGFISYYFGINLIADYHSAFGGEGDKLPIQSLMWFAEKIMFLVGLFVSIFFIKKKWFFIYVPAIIVFDAILGLIMVNLSPRIAFDFYFFWIPLIYIMVFYFVDRKYQNNLVPLKS